MSDNPFDDIEHDDYDPDEDQMDNSENPDPTTLNIDREDDPLLDEAP